MAVLTLAQSQKPGTTFYLSVVAHGQEEKLELQTKLDKSLPKSVITKEKADLTKGTVSESLKSSHFKDSDDAEYSTTASITLRCQFGESPKTFQETFYIVNVCQFDAVLRRDINKGFLKDELGCLPLKFRDKKQGNPLMNTTDRGVMS